MTTRNEAIVLDHYRQVAAEHGAGPSSTMADEITRAKEVELIHNFLRKVGSLESHRQLKVLEIGCGNGYLMESLCREFPEHQFHAADFSKELLEIASKRQLRNCEFKLADVRELPYGDNFFDVVFTERCLINLLDWEEQRRALSEIGAKLRSGGYCLFIESFSDGLDNNNKARVESGLTPIPQAHHNLYFSKEKFFEQVKGAFSVFEPAHLERNGSTYHFNVNFLSSHYFFARVVHPLLTKSEVRNSEFVKFFSFMPPIGNYSPIQAIFLQKR